MVSPRESKPWVNEHEARKRLTEEFLSKRGFEFVPETETNAGFRMKGNFLIKYSGLREKRIQYEIVCFPFSLDAPLELWEPKTFNDEDRTKLETHIKTLNKKLLQEFKKRGLYHK
jgi:hypothetical protein